MHVLLVGCGYVGSAFAHAALALWGRNVEVTALCRRPSTVPAGARGLALDLTDPKPWPPPAGNPADAVVFCAAPSTHDAAAYEAVYVHGTERVLTWLADAGRRPSRVLFISSTGVYGQNNGELVDEASATTPERYQGSIMLRAEAAARAGAPGACILRFGGIYGPGRDSLIRRMRAGEALWPPGTHYTNRIHRDDGVGAMLHMLQHEAPPPVCNVVDDVPATQEAVMMFLSKRLQLEVARPPVASGRVTGKRVSNAVLRSSGYACRWPSYEEGFDAILASVGVPAPSSKVG